jgi:pyrroline-5-carboxylate reductase
VSVIMPLNSSILLVGCGNMGSAMLNGWRAAEFSNISILDPQHTESIDINTIQTFDIVILAIKPQLANEILITLRKFLTPQTIILSIMAGVTIETISTLTNHNGAIFRSMPNTPAMIGKGITAIIGNEKTTDADKKIIETLLNTLGKIIWINSETDMNIVTAISGSGPAYLFYLTEILTNAAMKQGLSKDIAETLARETNYVRMSPAKAVQPNLPLQFYRATTHFKIYLIKPSMPQLINFHCKNY